MNNAPFILLVTTEGRDCCIRADQIIEIYESKPIDSESGPISEIYTVRGDYIRVKGTPFSLASKIHEGYYKNE